MNAPYVYLDNNATTQPSPECIDTMCACLRQSYGNPSSKHPFGEATKQLVMDAQSGITMAAS